MGAAVADGGDLEMPEDADRARRRNREAWDRMGRRVRGAAPSATGPPRRSRWGIRKVPESELQILAGPRRARTWSSSAAARRTSRRWLARRGARVVGVDITEEQLETARRMQAEHGLEFPLIHASAEDVPLPDASLRPRRLGVRRVDLVPTPTAGSPRRRGCCARAGELVFLVNGDAPDAQRRRTSSRSSRAGTELLRPYFGMRRFEWVDDDSVDFHLGYGDWIRLLRRTASRSSGSSSSAAPRTRLGARYDVVHRRVGGALAGRGDLEGAQGRRERPACAAAPPRLDLARSAARSSSSSASRSRSSRRDYEEHDPPDADPVELVRARAGKARSVRPRRATGRCSASTPTSSATAGSSASRPDAEDAERDARDALRARRTRSSPASACVTPAWEELAPTRPRASPSARSTPRDIAALRRSGRVAEPRRRLRDPGPRRRARRADRGRLPERGRPPGRAARPPACGRFAGIYGFG